MVTLGCFLVLLGPVCGTCSPWWCSPWSSEPCLSSVGVSGLPCFVSSQHSRTAGKLEKPSRPMQAAGLRKGQCWAVCEGALGTRGGGMEP